MVEVRCPWLPQLSLFRIFGPPLNPILTPFWPHEIAFWPYEMPLNPTNISLTPMKSHEFPPFQPIIPPHEANRPYGQQEGTRAVLQGTLKRGIKSSKHWIRWLWNQYKSMVVSIFHDLAYLGSSSQLAFDVVKPSTNIRLVGFPILGQSHRDPTKRVRTRGVSRRYLGKLGWWEDIGISTQQAGV